jgi:DNA-binding NarL/FixJ family response regulator
MYSTTRHASLSLVSPRRTGRRHERGLSRRERQVLELIAAGRTNTAIADELVIGTAAVEKHVANIFVKLQLPATSRDHRRVLAALWYVGARGDPPDGGSAIDPRHHLLDPAC